MLAAQKLRRLGHGCAALGGFGALVGLPLAWLFLGVKPLRTVGAHGMLPEDFHSLLLGSLFLGFGAVCASLLAVGLLCSLGSRLARISAIVIGPAALVVGAASRVYSPSSWPILDLALLPLTLLPGHAFAAYLTALGIASFSESRPQAPSRTTRWLTQPELLAGLVLVLAVLVDGALHPLTLSGKVEKQMTESDACSRRERRLLPSAGPRPLLRRRASADLRPAGLEPSPDPPRVKRGSARKIRRRSASDAGNRRWTNDSGGFRFTNDLWMAIAEAFGMPGFVLGDDDLHTTPIAGLFA